MIKGEHWLVVASSRFILQRETRAGKVGTFHATSRGRGWWLSQDSAGLAPCVAPLYVHAMFCVCVALIAVLAGWQQQQQQQRRQLLALPTRRHKAREDRRARVGVPAAAGQPQQQTQAETKNSPRKRPSGGKPKGHYSPAQPCRISRSRRSTSLHGWCLATTRRQSERVAKRTHPVGRDAVTHSQPGLVVIVRPSDTTYGAPCVLYASNGQWTVRNTCLLCSCPCANKIFYTTRRHLVARIM